MTALVERLIVTPQKPGKFTACLESTGEIIAAGTAQPLVDGARELLARGYDPSMPLAMRHQGSAHDSFRPAPISEWAIWTFEEGDRGLRKRRWMPRQWVEEGPKGGISPLAGTEGHPASDPSFLTTGHH